MAHMRAREALISHPPIPLTVAETELFLLLLDVVEKYNCNSVIRVAGGWVRDKLLCRTDNHDIDIAVDNMAGLEFANKVNDFLQSTGHKAAKVSVIRANPDQSKHLETATAKIGDLWLDIVNLRTETYNTQTRIPEMRFGTPLEDAQRRDFTINSMFYNIHTNEIEDLTELGLRDLQNKIIRTPLPAEITFLDDPLRILRAIRFVSRFRFELDSNIIQTTLNPVVKDALSHKVSRERIGIEVEGMISGNNARPALAFQYFCDLRICDVIFSLPESCNQQPPINVWELAIGHSIWMHRYLYWKTLSLENRSQFTIHDQETLEIVQRDYKIQFLSSLFIPIHDITFETKKDREVPVAFYIIRESLKFKVKDANDVVNIISKFNLFRELSRGTELDCVKAGAIIKELKELWPICVEVACVAELFDLFGTYPSTNVSAITSVMESFETLAQKIKDARLHDVWLLKPLLDGKSLINALNLPKGPLISKMMEQQFFWQILFPQGNVNELLDYLREKLVDLSNQSK